MRSIRQETEAQDMADLRRQAGSWLKGMRERRGLSQRQLADLVGLEYYTFVSQIEAGRGRIPSERYQQWADALGVNASDFVQNLLRFYDPATFNILFGGEEPPEVDGGVRPAPAGRAVVVPLRS